MGRYTATLSSVIHSLEQTAEELKDRCQILYRGCTKFMVALGEACTGDTAFADSLEAFCGGDDPISISTGGPVISKFITAFHEIASYKELLRSQVEHVLVDRLMHFITVDLQEAKDSRRRFEKAAHAYDQAREKFVSLKKSTPLDVVTELEEVLEISKSRCQNLQNSKSAFDRGRFNLVNALMNIEAKKKFEFLESISAIMDAHLRYFKLGYELLSQMEPFIHQVLTYAQQSKEMAIVEQDKLAKRIQEFRTQTEYESSQDSATVDDSMIGNGIHAVDVSSCNKTIEAIMQSSSNGEVQTIRQGYLLKRSSSSRSDWKRRFFILDSHGKLYYCRNKGINPVGFWSHHSSSSSENNSSVFGRFRSKHNRASSLGEETLDYCIVDLHTSTIKIDAEDTDLRLCFRIISPLKSYTLQAENEADRRDWITKIKGVIASLLSSHLLQQSYLGGGKLQRRRDDRGGDSLYVPCLGSSDSYKDCIDVNEPDSVAKVLRKIPGNDLCAECRSPEPDWASLNLGILLCIECSGVHRNLGVHISKVRSLVLDVKVWEPAVLDLFRSLGNAYCNSIWEEALLDGSMSKNKLDSISTPIRKPCPGDGIGYKEKFINAKYVDKLMVVRDTNRNGSAARTIWDAVENNNLREVYRLVVTTERSMINTVFDEVVGGDIFHKADQTDPANCENVKENPANCLEGCSLLHLACQHGSLVMVELLLQFGADINIQDFHGRTPLHHCVSLGRNALAKLLLKRGARPSIKDGRGQSALDRAMEMGAITDEELFILLAECQ
ncbi:ADP-ribosylation factor GTPase-activating protein AGD2-like isoform X2 [Punica granatum]|uniref:ADP-ribosylation factor GTPase-activating protein AGD2-like isoform X2 n=1 Tax=Punica granatum TaxID=22663 RepID=A0A6P8DEK5_PUNGR|nr:ADP-ribosylation factor GTPase-activating protein AGD2-like isoform X2 [Punica granatum]